MPIIDRNTRDSASLFRSDPVARARQIRTAPNLPGLRVGSVHTALEPGADETPGEGDQDPQSLEPPIRRARRGGTDHG